MSQQAVADAMAALGFSWRQTTVAKSEGADRPILFTEVVALSTILKRNLDYFLSGRNALDEKMEGIQLRLASVESTVQSAEAMLRASQEDRERVKLQQMVGVLILEYSRSLDSGPLKHELDRLVELRKLDLAEVKDLLVAAGVPVRVVESVDSQALRRAAEALKLSKDLQGKIWLPGYESDAVGKLAGYFLDGAPTPSYFLEALRMLPEYQVAAEEGILDAIIEHVEPRNK